ncbi:MAG: AraC family transcriptional regulator [Balneolaceae bacterium]|nr:AraC family transcriptional regulator [Balneolaceae bacterium]
MIHKTTRSGKIAHFAYSDITYREHVHMDPHCDHFFHISIVLSGKLRESGNGQEEEAGTLSVVTKPPDQMHSNIFGPSGARLLSLIIPQVFRTREEHRNCPISDWRWIHNGSLYPELVALIDAYVSFSGQSREEGDLFTERMELLLDAIAGCPLPPPGKPPAWVLQVRDHLHDTFHRTVPVSQIARIHNITPTHLTRCFNRYFGCPVTTYRHRLRVKAAAEKLCNSRSPLSHVALDSGFYDQSHFTKIFTRFTGKSPREFRSMVL